VSTLHNKSEKSGLAITEYNDAELESYYKTFQKKLNNLESIPGVIKGSPCKVHERFSSKGVKLFYTYHLIAWKKFGRENIEKILSVKTSKNADVISHLCGTRNCVVGDHLAIESKETNDTRTHCHWAIHNIRAKALEQKIIIDSDVY